MPRRDRRFAATSVWAAGLLTASLSIAGAAAAADLTDLNLEDLAQIPVTLTSAAKKSQDLQDTAAASYVLTSNDIRRLGARTVMDALRFVPGLDVFQVDQTSWAIGARGFASSFDRELLVMVDGRSIYSPAFSGVFWSLQQMLMDDIDRIEVMRGPGATLWGVNAVDGVINIITKNAADTQGTLAEVAAGGLPGYGLAAVRQGGKLENGYYRVYAQTNGNGAGITEQGQRGADSFLSRLAGFRADLRTANADSVTLSGNVAVNLRGEATELASFNPPSYSQTVNQQNHDLEANLVARWGRRYSDSSDLSVQATYTREEYNRPDVGIATDAADLQVQHRFAPTPDQDLIWGAEVRLTDTAVRTTFNFGFAQPWSVHSVSNLFVQDDIALVADTLHLVAGSKFEFADYAGFVAEPSLRLLYTPNAANTLWMAVSHAVRAPSVAERNLRFNVAVVPDAFGDGLPLLVQNIGTTTFHSENLTSLEAGHHWRPSTQLSVDTSLFWNFYGNLQSLETGTVSLAGGASPYYVLTMPIANKLRATTYGGEVAVEWRAQPWWRLRGSYSYREMKLQIAADSTDTVSTGLSGQSPRHQVILQSSADLQHNLQFDIAVKYTSALPLFTGDVTSGLPQRWTADMRLAYLGFEGIDLSLVGQNLGPVSRITFRPDILNWLPTKIGPTIYAKATVHF